MRNTLAIRYRNKLSQGPLIGALKTLGQPTFSATTTSMAMFLLRFPNQTCFPVLLATTVVLPFHRTQRAIVLPTIRAGQARSVCLFVCLPTSRAEPSRASKECLFVCQPAEPSRAGQARSVCLPTSRAEPGKQGVFVCQPSEPGKPGVFVCQPSEPDKPGVFVCLFVCLPALHIHCWSIAVYLWRLQTYPAPLFAVAGNTETTIF